MIQPGPQSAIGKGVTVQATAAELSTQPVTTLRISTLTTTQLTALKVEIAKSLSTTYSYAAVNSLGYIGKYLFDAPTLILLGYVSHGTTTPNLTTLGAWTPNKDGVSSINIFWTAFDIQEKIMDAYLTYNYNALVSTATVDSTSTPEDVAGKLAVAHILGANGCYYWAKSTIGVDLNGNTAISFYNAGRYAVTVLANLTG